MDFQPNLAGKLLRLIPLTEPDFENLYAVASDPKIWEQHPVQTRYQREVYNKLFKEFIESQSTLLIIDAATGEVAGSSKYYDYKPAEKSVAIGFTMLARKYWGGVYNRELKLLMLKHAFNFIERVYFHVGEHNVRSQKALAKIGAKQCGESIRKAETGQEIRSLHFEITKASFDAAAIG